MSTKALHYSDETASIDDMIDLSGVFSSDGRSTSMSGENYRISLHSIDDDELRRLHRDLVTPLPSVRAFEDDNLYRNMVRQRLPLVKPNTRSESVMLFKKINDGDEDVSFDIVNSDFKDFIDTEIMDDILSHPVNRLTKTDNRIEDLYKERRVPFYNSNSKYNNSSKQRPFKESLVNCSPNQRRDAFDKKENTPVHHTQTFSLERLSISNNNNTKNQRSEQNSLETYATTPKKIRNVVKVDTPHPTRPDRNKFSHTRSVTQSDEISSNHNNKKITARKTMASSSVWAPRKSTCQRPGLNETEESNPITRHRHISRAPELLGHTPKSHYSRPIKVSSSSYTQSDDKVTDTSSDDDDDDDESDFFSGNEKQHHHVKPFSIYSPIIHRKQSAQELATRTTMQRSVNDSYYSSPLLQQHRFSGSNSLNRHDIEYKTLSSPRLKATTNNNSNHHNHNNHNNHNVSVTDSAKQVLAYIRERRKSAMTMDSPKQSRPLQSSAAMDTVTVTDFKSRSPMNREPVVVSIRRPRNKIKPVIRRFDPQQEEDNNRLLSRLPQRTIYR